MAKKDSRISQRRLRSSYLTSVVSISLVLLLLGLVGFLVLNARNVSNYVKENIGINIELREGIREADMQQFKKMLDAREYVRATEYISREEAAVSMQKELGEDFIAFLGSNPLPATVKVKLNAPWANPDSIFLIEQELRDYDQLGDIYYQKTMLHQIHDNVRKISLIIISFSILLLVIALALINNTIRLRVYSRRFIIHTMQLVGATRGFIRKPFLWAGVSQGFIAGLISIALLLGIIYLAQNNIADLINILDPAILGILFAVVIGIGILISLISTFFAVNKYLNIEKDELYYR